MRISETRWPGENEYYSDQFRVIHSGGEESQLKICTNIDIRRLASLVSSCGSVWSLIAI